MRDERVIARHTPRRINGAAGLGALDFSIFAPGRGGG